MFPAPFMVGQLAFFAFFGFWNSNNLFAFEALLDVL